MQIVIEMSEETYRTIRDDNYTDVERYCGMLAIGNGKPLYQCKDCKYYEYKVKEMKSSKEFGYKPFKIALTNCTYFDNYHPNKEDYCSRFEEKENKE